MGAIRELAGYGQMSAYMGYCIHEHTSFDNWEIQSMITFNNFWVDDTKWCQVVFDDRIKVAILFSFFKGGSQYVY